MKLARGVSSRCLVFSIVSWVHICRTSYLEKRIYKQILQSTGRVGLALHGGSVLGRHPPVQCAVWPPQKLTLYCDIEESIPTETTLA